MSTHNLRQAENEKTQTDFTQTKENTQEVDTNNTDFDQKEQNIAKEQEQILQVDKTSKPVSVLMPVYNTEKYVAESIESILQQTFSDFEFIILDDCSTDRSLEIIQKYAKQDSRIRVYQNSQNQGISFSRNRLLDLAVGKYIAWQDADDISLPTRLQKQYAFMENNLDVGICGAWLQFFSEKEENLEIRKYPATDLEIRQRVFLYSPVSQGVSMIRRDLILKAGKFDPNLKQAEDLDLSLRLGKISKFANLQEVLLKVRYHPQSISTEKIKENIKFTLQVRKRAVKEYGYKMNLRDRIAYLLTFLASFLPANLVISAFRWFRNRLILTSNKHS